MAGGKKVWSDSVLVYAIVTILIGLVVGSILYFTYYQDKTQESENDITIEKPENISSTKQTNIPEQVSVKIIYDALHDYEKEIEKQREIEELKQLRVIDDDKKISDIPWGTYFYIHSRSFYKLNLTDKDSFNIFKNRIKIKRSNERGFYSYKNSYFEIHYRDQEDIYLIGFVQENDALSIINLDGMNEKKISIVPRPVDNLDDLVILPINRIENSEKRDVTFSNDAEIDVLDLTLI